MISEVDPHPDRLVALEENIRELGEKIDSHKAKTAGALGGAVFTLLLALGGGYDLIVGNAGVWLALGLTLTQVYWLAIGLTALGVLLLATAFVRRRNYDATQESRLEQMQVELSELLADRAEGQSHPDNA